MKVRSKLCTWIA